MSALLRSLGALILGETRTIPLGVAATVVIGVALRSALPGHVWQNFGGFALAGMIVATLALSLGLRR